MIRPEANTPVVSFCGVRTFGTRNQNTSIGAPRSRTSRPAAARKIELRPSAAIVRRPRSSSSSPPIRQRRPATRSASTISPVASASMCSVKPGYFRASAATKSRNSHCGIIAMKFQRGSKRDRSAMRSERPPPTKAPMPGTLSCGRASRRSSRPSSWKMRNVDGWTVSPRKSRRKSPCFSSTVVRSPARAKSRPATIPAGPPPAMTMSLSCLAMADIRHGCGIKARWTPPPRTRRSRTPW